LPADGSAAAIINLATEHSVEDFRNTEVVAWVQGPDKTVFQATRLNNTYFTDLGMGETSKKFDAVNVFPNPSNDKVTVSFKTQEAQTLTFVLVDMMGNVVMSFDQQSNVGVNNTELNTQQLASGVYHLMIFDSKNNAHVEKIAIQH